MERGMEFVTFLYSLSNDQPWTQKESGDTREFERLLLALTNECQWRSFSFWALLIGEKELFRNSVEEAVKSLWDLPLELCPSVQNLIVSLFGHFFCPWPPSSCDSRLDLEVPFALKTQLYWVFPHVKLLFSGERLTNAVCRITRGSSIFERERDGFWKSCVLFL